MPNYNVNVDILVIANNHLAAEDLAIDILNDASLQSFKINKVEEEE